MAASGSTVEIRELAIDYVSDAGPVRVVDGMSLTIRPGERLALVGESGAGKSVTARAILGLIEEPGRVVSGEILLDGKDVLKLSDDELVQMRGAQVGLVFQNPSTALDPAFRTGWQLEEALKAHASLPRESVRGRAIAALGEVGIPEPLLLAKRYPHEFSGGMQQRLYIAMTLLASPRLLIADEPTTALDVTIQAQILDLLMQVASETGMTMLLITHDMGVVARVCDRVAVMYAGELVEEAPVDDLFSNPQHPYTRALLECLPDPSSGRRQVKSIPGSGEQLDAHGTGCRFKSRCKFARAGCEVHPQLLEVGSQHTVRCWVAQEDGTLPPDEPGSMTSDTRVARPNGIRDSAVLQLHDVTRRYAVSNGPLRRPRELRAVDGVTLDVFLGETLGVVGESGSGKSTLAKLMVGLEEPDSGAVEIDERLLGPSHLARRPFLVFQDPQTSLDPRMKVGLSVGEPLIGVDAGERRTRVRDMLGLVGLDDATIEKYPHQLSGGQQQRACIARALIAGTKVVVLDEALSSLDASMQARMINLLEELKVSLGLTYIFVSHNLSVVDAIADRTSVMYLGKVVELGPTDELQTFPLHPYTVALHAAVPAPNPAFERERERLTLRGEIGSGLNLPSGCRFHPRCPLATDLCRTDEPQPIEYRPGHWSACHFSAEWANEPTGSTMSLARRMLAA